MAAKAGRGVGVLPPFGLRGGVDALPDAWLCGRRLGTERRAERGGETADRHRGEHPSSNGEHPPKYKLPARWVASALARPGRALCSLDEPTRRAALPAPAVRGVRRQPDEPGDAPAVAAVNRAGSDSDCRQFLRAP